MNKYKGIIGRANYFLFLVAVASLPFPQVALRFACVLWMFAWVLEGRWLSRPESPKKNKMVIPFLLFGAWFAWHAISGIWVADHAAWAWQMERYLLFCMILPIGIWGLNRHYDWRQIGAVLVWSCIIAVPFYLITITLFYHHPELLGHFQWREPWDFTFHTWYTFFSENLSILKHRLFFCSVELTGAVVAWQIWRYQWKKLIPALVIMLSAIPLSGSRQAILTAAVLLAIILILELPRHFRFRYGALVFLVSMALGAGLLKFHPRMQAFDIKDITEMREINYEHEVRFNIWGVALRHPKDYLLTGIGGGQSTNYMLAGYQEMGCTEYFQNEFNSHNQYLEETIELGIFGLFFFLIAWLSIPLCAQKRGRHTAILFSTLFMLNMCTDCMFGRFCGIGLWAFGVLFILLQSHAESKE